MAGGTVVPQQHRTASIVSSELLGELLSERVRCGIGDDVHMLRHLSPRFRLAAVVLGLQLLDLSDVMPAVRLQKPFDGVF